VDVLDPDLCAGDASLAEADPDQVLGIVRPHLESYSPALFRRDRTRRADQRLAQPR
jgi:hypothetical protein